MVGGHGDRPVSAGHGLVREDACSRLWDRAGDGAYGTAAVATFFVLLEQNGPWGRDAARQSHLDAGLGDELDRRASARGGRFMLLRRPGGHADHEGPATVLVAHTGVTPGLAWLLRAEVHARHELLALDWDALGRGDRESVTTSLPGSVPADPALLVCTNGRRDVCCAVRGRPVAAAASAAAPERVWESTHTGGHRFAPTAVLLPWGLTYARLTGDDAAAILAASAQGRTPAGLLGSTHDRGRSALDPASQCAESTVRARLGETRIVALWAEPASEGDLAEVLVRHEDGRAWAVTVTRDATGEQRPESCGKGPVPVHEHRAVRVTPA
jgi:hypothetical protein